MIRKMRKRQRGQALTEYIIIIVIVAIMALVVLGAFSNRIRTMIAGATNSLGGDAQTEQSDSLEKMKEMKGDGLTD